VDRQAPYRVRFRVPLTVLPPIVGVGVAAALWGDRAELQFFVAATHVLAIGSVAMALSGNFFRLSIHRDHSVGGAYAIVNVVTVLLFTGLGLFFSFRALAVGHAGPADLAIAAGALATGITAFGGQALFGTPGLEREEAPA
jgi:hypothetical protein